MQDDRSTDLLRGAADSSARLLAGVVPKRTMQELQKLVRSTAESGETYPWQTVVDRVLEDPVDDQDLLQRTMRAQRDWVLRGGRETPKQNVGARAKGSLARLVARLIFFGIYTVAVVVLLNLVKHVWPEVDIYVLLEFAQKNLPSVFGLR